MKKLIFALCLLLTLSACGQATPSPEDSIPPKPSVEDVKPNQTVPSEEPADLAPLPPAEEADNEAETPAEVSPESPEEAKEPEQAEQPQSPVQAEAVPELPPLPQPVYCCGSTVISSKGQVVLDASEHQPQLLRDAATNEVRAIALLDGSGHLVQLCDLNGQPLLDDLYTNEYGILGDLFWYQTQNLYQVLRLSDGAILYQDLELVVPLEGMLAVQPMFWMTRCSLLDGDGQVVRELPPNYHLKTIFQTGKKAYLILEDRFGKQTVADSKGTPYLDRFYDEVSVVAGDYAQVRDGSTWMAVDLNSGKTVYRKNGSFQLLPGSILVESGSRGEVKLLDFQGKALYPSPLLDPAPLNEVWMTAARPTNDTYTTVILDYHGKEILALPTEATFLSSLSPNLLFYAAFTGQDTILQKGILRDMDSGREVLLMEGKYLKADTLDVTDGSVILCRGVSLDGVPISRLFTIEGKEILPNVTILDYAGGDVFVTDQGLICLDGTWLYKE